MLVAEGDRLQRKDCFAGFVHRRNRLLETLRGDDCAEVAVGIDNDPHTSGDGDPTNASEISVGLSSYRADADGVGLGSNTKVADVDIVAASGETETGSIAERNVACANRIAIERIHAARCVELAACVLIK